MRRVALCAPATFARASSGKVQGAVIGIDLGTTYSCVACMGDKPADWVQDANGKLYSPFQIGAFVGIFDTLTFYPIVRSRQMFSSTLPLQCSRAPTTPRTLGRAKAKGSLIVRSPGTASKAVKPPPGLSDEVHKLVAKLLGEAFADVVTDELISKLKSEDYAYVSNALGVLAVYLKIAGKAPSQPIDDTRMIECAKAIAALNVPKTLFELLDGHKFGTLPKCNYVVNAVNVTKKISPDFITNNTKVEDTRVMCVTAVVGPSGSGKTTFSAWRLTKQLREKVTQGHIMITYHDTYKSSSEPSSNDVYAKVEKLRQDTKGIAKPKGKDYLKEVFLHVIVDECDKFPSMTDAEFKDWRGVRIKHFLKRFAGVHITLAGTMLDARMAAVGSESPGFAKIRLRPWTSVNFQAFLKSTVHGSEEVDAVAKFVVKSPLMMSLTTNARAAVFLVGTVSERLVKGVVRASTSSILDQVVYEYLRYNGLSPYTAAERACVGLSALRCALGLHTNADNSNVPSDIEEHCIRCGLLTWNVERTKEGKFICVDGKPRLEVQPALVIVCLVMCGLLQSTQHIEGWGGVELIAALWAACSIPYRAEVGNNSEGNARLVATTDSSTPHYHINAHAFGHKLADNKLLFADIKLDDVATTAVINADKGHGMDVVAPWVLIQAKHNVSPNSPYTVNVMEELGKAGLFSGSPLQPLTKALVLAWKKVPSSTPPAVLEPLSHLLEHIPKARWGTVIVADGGKLKELKMKSPSVNKQSQACVITKLAVDPVPKGSVRVVLLLFGHSFLLRTSGGGAVKNKSPQLQVSGSSGCVRLLTVTGKKVVANNAAVPAGDKAAQSALNALTKDGGAKDVKAQGALTTLAAAVTKASPAFNFVLDVVYQPLQ